MVALQTLRFLGESSIFVTDPSVKGEHANATDRCLTFARGCVPTRPRPQEKALATADLVREAVPLPGGTLDFQGFALDIDYVEKQHMYRNSRIRRTLIIIGIGGILISAGLLVVRSLNQFTSGLAGRTVSLFQGLSRGVNMVSAASRLLPQSVPDHFIRCYIQTERQEWTRSSDAIVVGKIENLTQQPLELDLAPELYLSAKTSGALGDTLWAPADLFRDAPLATDRKAIDKKLLGESIEARRIHLRLQKDETVNFKIDARHLKWAQQISSVWPSFDLFSIVKSDVYDLQLLLETNSSTAKSNKIALTIDARKTEHPPEQDTPEDISRAMFPNAPGNKQDINCFRSLTAKMSVNDVVEKCGRPDAELGSGLYIFVWHMPDGSSVSIGTPHLERIGPVRLTDASGKTTVLPRKK